MSTVLSSFESWKHFLSERVAQGKNMGMTDDMISNLAYEIGEFLDEKVDPKNEEQRVLKEIWDVGDDQERKTLARMMVKLVQHS